MAIRLASRLRRWWRYGRHGIAAWLIPLLEWARENHPESPQVTSRYRTAEEQRALTHVADRSWQRSNHYLPPRAHFPDGTVYQASDHGWEPIIGPNGEVLRDKHPAWRVA